MLLLAVIYGVILRGSSYASAQAPRDLRHEVLTTWTTEQGLPQDFVTAIQQTPDGFLWVGTNGGLARFDGLHFRTFLRDGPTALRHRINCLLVDREGTLWVGTSTGLFSYKSGIFSELSLSREPSMAIEQIVRSPHDNSVFVRTKEKLYRVDSSGSQAVDLPLNLAKVLDLAVDREGKQWFADGDQIIEVANQRVIQSFHLPNANLLYCGPDGKLFAGDGHHLFQFTSEAFEALPKQGAEEFVSVLIDREGSLWMASGGLEGISRFANGKFEIFGVRDGLASNDARVIFEDHSGDIWVGTISGLQHLHRGTFLSYTDRDGLPHGHNQYDSVFEDRVGTVWTGTLESGVARLTDDAWQSYGTAQGVRRGQVRGFADDTSLPIIAMADYGLFAFSNGKYRKLPGIPPGYISSPVRTSDGALWFSVLHKGVYRLRNNVLTPYGPAEGLNDNVVWALLPGYDGALWAGSKSGAFRWDGSHWSLVFPSTSAVDSIALSHDGGIFLGTANGLVYRNGSNNWSLTQEDGLPGDAVFSVVEDKLGDLWLGTARGICRISRAQVDALSNGVKRVTPELFTEDDGLRSRTVLPMAQVTATRSRDGRVWFATASGPVVGEPGMNSTEAPRAALEDVSVDEVHFAAASLTVKPGRHRLTFNFTAPVFIAADQVRFRYRLIGWDTDWVNAGDVREASYMGIPPGTYSFQVQALGRTGEPGPASTAISVRLTPFFWETRTFLVLLVVALVAIVIEVTRRRTLRRAEALNLRFQERAAERERLASHIHDTFIQDLTGTALQLELLGLQLDEDPDVARYSLNQLAARMREMIARSRDIVSNLHSMAGMQDTLLELLSHVETEFRLADTPEFVLQSKGESPALHPFLRDEVYSICREAVANAFRHANAKTIDVSVVFSSDKLIVRVHDDGVGMPEEILIHGRAGHFGLTGMHAHARRIEATLTIQSTLETGTIVTLETALRPGESKWTNLWSLARGSIHKKPASPLLSAPAREKVESRDRF